MKKKQKERKMGIFKLFRKTRMAKGYGIRSSRLISLENTSLLLAKESKGQDKNNSKKKSKKTLSQKMRTQKNSSRITKQKRKRRGLSQMTMKMIRMMRMMRSCSDNMRKSNSKDKSRNCIG